MAEYRSVRMTMPTRTVLAALLDNPTEELWGMRLMQLTTFGSGTIYPILTRLEDRGWIEGYWETEQPDGRPRRRYWKLTTWGAWRAREALGRTAGAEDA